MIKFLYIKKQKKSILLYNKQQRGLSLIELMVAVVILGIVVLGLVTFFMGGTKSWVAGQYQLKAQREARQAMDRMVREIRGGSTFVIDPNDNSIAISYPSSFSKDPVTYKLTGTTIGREVNSVSSPMINNVKKLEFASTDASKVHIDLEVDVDNDGNPDIILNTDVMLRNCGLQ